MTTSAFLWNAFGLFLVLLWIAQRLFPRGWKGTALAAVIAALISFIPFFGHVPRFWLSGLTPNISVPMFALLVVSIFERTGFSSFLRPQDLRAAFLFGAVSALALYPSALGLGLSWLDAYALGWPWLEWVRSAWLFGAVAFVSGFLVWRRNRFGWVLVASALLYLFAVQESRNFWDYLVDPLYAAISLMLMIKMSIDRLRRR